MSWRPHGGGCLEGAGVVGVDGADEDRMGWREGPGHQGGEVAAEAMAAVGGSEKEVLHDVCREAEGLLALGACADVARPFAIDGDVEEVALVDHLLEALAGSQLRLFRVVRVHLVDGVVRALGVLVVIQVHRPRELETRRYVDRFQLLDRRGQLAAIANCAA